MRQMNQVSWTRPDAFMMQWKVSFFLGTVKIIRQGRMVSSSSTSSLSFQVKRRILGRLRLLGSWGSDFFLLSLPFVRTERKIKPMQRIRTTAMAPAISFRLLVCAGSECLVLTTLKDSGSLDGAGDKRERETFLVEAERVISERIVMSRNTVSLFWHIEYYNTKRKLIPLKDRSLKNQKKAHVSEAYLITVSSAQFLFV